MLDTPPCLPARSVAPVEPPLVTLRVQRLRAQVAKAPHHAVDLAMADALRIDLACEAEHPIVINPERSRAAPTGISVAIPIGYEGQIRLHSAWLRSGVTLLNAPAVVTPDYHDEITLFLLNLRQDTVTLQPGDSLAQLVIVPVTPAAPPPNTQPFTRTSPSDPDPRLDDRHDVDAVLAHLIDQLAQDAERPPKITAATRVTAPLQIHRLVTPGGALSDAVTVRLLSSPHLAKLIHVLARVPALGQATFELFVEHALAAPDLTTRQAAVLAADLRDIAGTLPALLCTFAAIEPDAALADWARNLARRLEAQGTGDIEVVTLRAREAALRVPSHAVSTGDAR